jgi:hypothetical protein
MPDESYNLFVSQLNDVCAHFPNLRIKEKENRKILKGTVTINNSDNTANKSYSIEIHWKNGFPYQFPILYEVGGDIPCEADWHKYPNNSCCITVDYDENLKCKSGITILQFIQKEVIPYLANQWYRQISGKYKAEYSHGEKAHIEFMFNLAYSGRKINMGRNEKCFCGSSKKYKHCHESIIECMKKAGKETMIKFLISKGISI